MRPFLVTRVCTAAAAASAAGVVYILVNLTGLLATACRRPGVSQVVGRPTAQMTHCQTRLELVQELLRRTQCKPRY